MHDKNEGLKKCAHSTAYETQARAFVIIRHYVSRLWSNPIIKSVTNQPQINRWWKLSTIHQTARRLYKGGCLKLKNKRKVKTKWNKYPHSVDIEWVQRVKKICQCSLERYNAYIPTRHASWLKDTQHATKTSEHHSIGHTHRWIVVACALVCFTINSRHRHLVANLCTKNSLIGSGWLAHHCGFKPHMVIHEIAFGQRPIIWVIFKPILTLKSHLLFGAC